MKRRRLLAGVLVAVLTLWTGLAIAQEATTGAIEGTATDPQGNPLAGVAVTISSAQGTKTITTDANGHFRFPYLMSGMYGLSASLHGYTTAERQNIDVRLTSRVRVELILTPGVSEKIEVVGAAPVVDLTSTTTGATISSELMSSIPVGRSFSNTLALAPGVVASGIDNANPSVGGASGLENTYIVDGVNIGNPGYGSAGSYSIIFGSLGTGVNYDYIQEVQVKTGGYEPEYGEALGGFINLVTKTGGNTFKGSAFTYQQFSGLEASRVRTDRQRATFDPIGFSSQDYGFEAGGPVVTDKAFWFAAFDPTFTTRTRETAKAIKNDPTLGFDHTLKVDRTIYNYAGNVKWFVNPKHTLTVSAFGDPSVGPNGPQREEAASVPDPKLKFSKILFGGNNVVGRWNGELLPNWFAEGSVAYHQDRFEETPARVLPSGIDNRTAVPKRYGGVGFFENSKSRNTQYALKLSNFVHAAGEHNFRYGLEIDDIGYDHTANYSGPAGVEIQLEDGTKVRSSSGYSWDINASASRFRINRIRSGSLTSLTTTRYYAGFLSDSWSPTKYLNIMAGVRNEQERLNGNLTHFVWKDNWAPRLHVTLDPVAAATAATMRILDVLGVHMDNPNPQALANKSKLSFAYGRFFGKVPNDLAVRALSSEVTYVVRYDLSKVDLSDPNNPKGLGPDAQLHGPGNEVFVFGNTPTRILPDAKLTYQDEYVTSYEQEVAPYLNLGVSFMHRSLGRTLEDTQEVSYSDILGGIEDFGEYVIRNPGPPLFPTPTRKYNAVSFKAERRFHDNWQLLGSYTWSRLKGNYEGYYRRDNGQSDPFITSLFDFPGLKDPDVWGFTNADGLLPNDRTHVFNMFGSYRLGFDLNVGMSVKVQSGVPITKLGFNEVYGNGGEIVLEPRGASGRMPTTTDVGLHLDYPLNVGSWGKRFDLSLDVFNLLNQQKGVDFESEYEVGGTVNPPARLQAPPYSLVPCPTCVNPDFGKPIAFQAPLQVLIAARAKY